MRAVLRVLHLVALSVAVFSLGVASLAWLQSHGLDSSSGWEFAKFFGLAAGVVLGAVLLWGSLRSSAWNARNTIGLHLCWLTIFGWYWFNRFGVTEVHSFDPQQMEIEIIYQRTTSVAFFLLWAILCSIVPAFWAARKCFGTESSETLAVKARS